MSFQLVIAEKPSVARSIATVIGATEGLRWPANFDTIDGIEK